MGGNVNAARLSGVKTQKMLFLAYVNMGLLAALAGLVYAARLNAASPQAGQGDELYAIASCYIGGASAYGGIGTIGGALIGAMTMGVIKNGMSIMSPEAVQNDGPNGIYSYALSQYANTDKSSGDPCAIDADDKNASYKAGVSGICTPWAAM